MASGGKNGLAPMRAVLRLSSARVSGPTPSFGPAHIMLALLTIGGSSYIGREALANETGLGYGAVRSVLKKLRRSGYVEAVRSGCYLTSRGKRLMEGLHAGLSGPVTMSDSHLTLGGREVAISLRGAGRKIRSGIEQRDAAIRVGASGVTSYLIQGGRFSVPGGSRDCEIDYPGTAWKQLRSELRPKNGDAVIVCGATGETTAKLGALAAALTLV